MKHRYSPVSPFSTLVIAAVLIGVASYIGFTFKDKQYSATYQDYVTSGKEAFRQGNLVFAAQALEKATSRATSPLEKAKVQYDLALIYHLLGKEDEAVSLFKKIAGNTLYPSEYRGGAVHRLLALYTLTKNQETAKRYIFSGEELWSSFIKEGNVELAVRRGYEWANELYPSAIAEYLIARWYGERGFEDPEKDLYREAFIEHIKKGEALFPKFLLAPYLETWEDAALFYQRGVTFGLAYVLTDDKTHRSIAEDSFTQALEILETIPEDYADAYRRGTQVFILYDYAAFLAYLKLVTHEEVGGKIQELVDTLLKEKNLYTLGIFLSQIKTLPDENFVKKKTLLLAQAEPRFSQRLRELGWEGK